jgi:hypothetical protein
LKDFNIQIIHLSERHDLQNLAVSIKNELVSYGLKKIEINSISYSKGRKLVICPWSSIRYDPGEENAARELKSIMKKIATSQTWDLLALPMSQQRKVTNGSVSIFLDDLETFKSVYYPYGQKQRLACDQNRQK